MFYIENKLPICYTEKNNKRLGEIMSQFWNDKRIYNINSIKRYASKYPLSEDYIPKTKVLNGIWKFKFCENVYEIPKGYQEVGYDLKDFSQIKVPSNWQIEGFDTPIYTNIVYPYAITAKNLFRVPYIKPNKNSVGCYVTFFDLKDIKDKNFFINFGGINSAGEVYVNGEFVGYSEDTFDEQEYDITQFVKEGENKLAVTVYRYCTGSYLEDQDMWRLSGIFRDVTLIEKPKVEIADFFTRSSLYNDYKSAKFLATIEVASKGKILDNLTLEYALKDKDGEVVLTDKLSVEVLSKEHKQYIEVKKDLDGIKLWSHENPYLYSFEVKLYQKDHLLDFRRHNFGFREIRIEKHKDGKGPFILLNGKPIKFTGVNRHEFHPEYGHAVPKELIRRDLELCLKNNITAIRNSHYPNSRVFYELCDEMGILVMAENNLETHGLAFMIPRNSKLWTEHCIYRLNNMVNTLKNHPCIVSWSLGNEAGFGKAFFAMRQAVLAIDTTRFIHYEPDTSGKVSDVLSEMYAKLEKMPLIGENKPIIHCIALWNPFGAFYSPEKYKNLPFIQCEYSHAMGNSLGNFADYWEQFKKYDRLSGGFIWDFADQAILYNNPKGYQEWRYGGDFGDKPNSGNFAFNGIFRADRTPNPSLYEVKRQYQQVDFSYENKILKIKNRYLFTDISEFGLRLIVLDDGEKRQEREYTIPQNPPGEIAEIKTNISAIEGKELSIIAQMYLKEEKGCLPKGHIVAYDQFMLTQANFKLEDLKGGLSCQESQWEIVAEGDGLRIIVEKKTGSIISINKDGEELLKTPIVPNFWRATIDNDRMASVDIKIVKKILRNDDAGVDLCIK